MDIQMPIMDGLTAAKLIRKTLKSVPIVALSAHAMRQDISDTQNVGMNDHLTKPIVVDDFFEVLLKYISKKTTVTALPSPKIEKWILPELKVIDTKIGLAHLGGDLKLYLKLMLNFVSEYKNAGKDLDLLLSSNVEDAHRLIHTIKGLSGNIGALKLSEKAKILEDELTPENLVKFKISLGETIDDLQNNIHIEKDTVAQTDKQEITTLELIKLMQELSEAIDVERPKRCISSLDELFKYSLPVSHADILVDIKNSIENFDFDEAKEKIEQIRHIEG